MEEKRTIHVLDDREENGRLIRWMLAADSRLEPVLFTDSDEFLRGLEVAPRRPDLLILDVMLPGKSGPTLAAELRQQFPELPILLVSGFAAAMEDAGFEFLSKPFSRERLLEKVRLLLEL